MSGTDFARELRRDLVDPRTLVERLGLAAGPRALVKQASGVSIRCPWHEERTPSCSVRVAGDGTIAVRCHACGATGDALTLVAVAHGLDVRRDFHEVKRIAAELAGRWDLVAAFDRRGRPLPSPPQRETMPPAPRSSPPAHELAALFAATVDVTSDPEAVAMLEARGFEADWIDDCALARVLPKGATLPRWARFRGRPWTGTGHRLVLPVVDPTGTVRSVRAWRVTEGDTPKRLPPAGHKASGLVLADEFALAMLRGTFRPALVVVLEGESDFLTWTAARVCDAPAARLGVVSGSWSDDLAARVPEGADVVVRTDHDAAGERYAREVAASLWGRCRVFRSRATSGGGQ